MTDVLAEVGGDTHLADLGPGAPRPWVAFKTTFVAEPHVGVFILLPGTQLFAGGLALLCVLIERPGARHFELVVLLVKVTHGSAVAELGLQMLFDPAVELHGGPVCLAGQRRVFDHWHDLFGDLLLGQDAPPPAAASGDEAVETGEVEGVDEAQHLPCAEERERSDLLAAFALIQPAKGLQPAEAFFGGRAVHGHANFLQSRVLQVQLHAWAGHSSLQITARPTCTAQSDILFENWYGRSRWRDLFQRELYSRRGLLPRQLE